MISIASPDIGQEEIDAVVAVMQSGVIVHGSKTQEFEEKFAEYCGARYAVAMNSGTAAVHAGLYAVGVSSGDEVITSPFTFVASANPILMQGAKVVFADIAESDFNIDPKEIEKKITTKTKAIVPVDLYGRIYDHASVQSIIKGRDIKIVEDACQAIGAERSGMKAGRFGDVGAFSLYATKNITSGEGGMIVTDNEVLAEQCRRFRHHGQSPETQYEYHDIGYNYRMTDMGAAIGLAQLGKVDRYNARRIKNAETFLEGLQDIPGISLPTEDPSGKHVFHQYTIRITKEYGRSRDDLAQYLEGEGVQCRVYYPKPLHLHPHFKRFGYVEGDFPVAERISREVLSLPIHPKVTREDARFIIDKIRTYAR